MCGIAGFFSQTQKSPEISQKMLQGIAKRGPDYQNIIQWGKDFSLNSDIPFSSLIHARLAIRDLSSSANQPMSNASCDTWICYNGEIYDWENDAEKLKSKGYIFQSTSDTEYILHAYSEYGLDGLFTKLRGMFSIAILDLKVRKIHLIRDRFGIKPLIYYYNKKNKELAFGSTIRSVVPYLKNSEREFSAAGIDAFLTHKYIPAPLTIYSYLQRLENASFLSFSLDTGEIKKEIYWTPKPDNQEWENELDKAINIRTVSDRPIGAFLSGGIDSSTLVYRLHSLGYKNLQCFTASFPDSTLDESKDAKEFADKLKLPNKKIDIPKSIAKKFSSIISDLDEPFADPSSIPTWYLSKETVKDVTVVLGGDGGDEIFAGYKRYKKHLRSKWRLALPFISSAKPSWHLKGKTKVIDELKHHWKDAYSFRFSGMHLAQRRYLQPSYQCKVNYWRQPKKEISGINYLLEIDRLNYLPEYILRKADLCTMAHGLEQRIPLLDHVLYQKFIALPKKLRFTQPAKQLLKDIAPLITPIFKRKKKGFNPPLASWLKTDLKSNTINLGKRLEKLTFQQISAHSCDKLISCYYDGENNLAEQVLQLIILEESLQQLSELNKETMHGK